jgi:hypothetical protein
VGNKQHIIELNGRLYNALTGEMLGPKSQTTEHSVANNVRSVDGLRASVVKARSGSAAAHAIRKPSRSHTLHRSAVKKPTKTTTQNVGATAKPQTGHNASIIHTTNRADDSARHARAIRVERSQKIARFSFSDVGIKHKKASLKVKPAPELATVHSSPPLPVIPDDASLNPQNPFIKAIEQAESHNQKRPKKPKFSHRIAGKLRVSRRTLNSASAALAVVLLFGFVAYLNSSTIAIRVAAARAGVNVKMPGYSPADFKVNGPISYRSGQISIGYASTTDNRRFQLKQTASTWNSDTLLENFVNANQLSYQTFQDKGKTVFIYDGSSATWVDGGVWYQIEGNSSLNSDQLLRLAASL